MNKIYDLVAIGDAAVDINIPMDSYAFGAAYDKAIKISPGGDVNIAFWLARSGFKTAFVGCVGKDCFGDFFISQLKRSGIKPFVSRRGKTALIACLNYPDDRVFVVDRGANLLLGKKDISKKIIASSKWLFMSGYSLASKNRFSTTLYSSMLAKDFCTKILFGGGSFNILKNNLKNARKLLSFADLAVMNKDEAIALSGKKSLAEAFSFFKNNFQCGFAITLGKRGSLSFDGRKKIFAKPLKARPVKSVVGAGDAFAAGLLAGIIRGKTFEAAVKEGHFYASKAVSIEGAV